MKRILQFAGAAAAMVCIAWACGHDNSVREYLSKQFWFPFARATAGHSVPHPRRLSAPFAGMDAQTGPLARLRSHYQSVARSQNMALDPKQSSDLLAAARAVPNLTAREREEIELIDAKLDIRTALPEFREPYRTAEKKLLAFLKAAKTPEFLSEARGWLAHVYYQQGDRTRAGKLYIDELSRTDSNLSLATLRDSLSMTYGYNGGAELEQHLDRYFDTPEHAAFAITLLTNPRWNRWSNRTGVTETLPFARINELLKQHASLFRSESGSQTLAVLSMRTALRAGDPAAALQFAAAIPAKASVRSNPDFLWMLGSAHFLSRQYNAAKLPLLLLYRSRIASDTQRAAAAYGLCGVYAKTRNRVEQIRMALWLHTRVRVQQIETAEQGSLRDGTVYWAMSGWDLGMLLDLEASEQDLRAFLEKYGSVPDAHLVRYALAIRLARADRYEEAAEEFTRANAPTRAARMRTLAALWSRIRRANDMTARVEMAEFLANNGDGIYFNPTLWYGFQDAGISAAGDSRLTKAERDHLITGERRVRDEQEERWRGYQLAREVVEAEGHNELGRRAAQVAIRCLRGINTRRFGREKEIAAADIELTRWLRRRG